MMIIFLLSFSVVFLQLNTQASAIFKNTFIPSSQTINEIDNSTETTVITQSEKKFDEYDESSIDKNGFYLRIDKISLFKKIIQDVDPRDKDGYVKSWEGGVSHGKFTSTPEKIGLTYLFAHATSNPSSALKENAWFTFLDQMSVNDNFIIYYKGVKYIYQISNIYAVSPSSTGFYTGASSVPMARLQYCGPPTGSLNSRTLVDGLLIEKKMI